MRKIVLNVFCKTFNEQISLYIQRAEICTKCDLSICSEGQEYISCPTCRHENIRTNMLLIKVTLLYNIYGFEFDVFFLSYSLHAGLNVLEKGIYIPIDLWYI